MKSKCFVKSCGREVEHHEIFEVNGKRYYLFRCNGPRDRADEAMIWSIEIPGPRIH